MSCAGIIDQFEKQKCLEKITPEEIKEDRKHEAAEKIARDQPTSSNTLMGKSNTLMGTRQQTRPSLQGGKKQRKSKKGTKKSRKQRKSRKSKK